MKKLLTIAIALLTITFYSCSDEESDPVTVKGSWEFGSLSTIKYDDSTSTLPISQSILNKIVCYYAGIESTSDLVLSFEADKTIKANGTTIPESAWSESGTSFTFNIGKDLNFTGVNLGLSYVYASATNIPVDVLPETVKTIIELVGIELKTSTSIEKLTVYLDKQ